MKDCACGCCTGLEPATPLPVYNRSGLPEVRYRAGTYAEFRASLHAALSAQSRPALAGLTTRDETDLTIALLDGVACVADVLTFAGERLANESFLRTARERMSLGELGRLVGYRLRPGVAAATRLAFHVEPPPPAPVAAATSPFRAVRMPTAVTIPAGTVVRSVPGPGEQPQVFETSEAIEARPEWNLMRPTQTLSTLAAAGDTSLYARGVSANLRAGDVLLFLGNAPDQMLTRPITTVTTQPTEERTLVTWREPLVGPGPWTPRVMRKRLSVFGHNAPMWMTMSKEFRRDYGGASATEWPYFIVTSLRDVASGDLSWLRRVDLDGSHPDIIVGRHVVISVGGKRAVYRVEDVNELSRSEYAVSGKVTRVLLDRYLDWWTMVGAVRTMTVFAVDEELTPAPRPDTTPVAQTSVTVSGDVSALPAGRTLLVTAGAAVEVMTLAHAALAPGATAADPATVLTFTGALAGSYDRAAAGVFGNVAAATHGESVHQILGDGQAGRTFQTFPLRHAPLTYVPSTDPSGGASTLELRVNDVAWHERPTLYQAAPGERVFVTRDTPAGEVVVETGDGVRGARLPTGQHNVRAVYRKGIGTAGNVPAGALSQLSAPPLGVTGVTNPGPAQGGADPDTVDRARTGIPLSTRTLGRAVSLLDYADYARAFAGIAKAHAAVLPVHNVRTIVVTVAGEDGAAVPDATRARLADSLRGYGDPLAPVLVVGYRPARFALRMGVRTDPDRDADTVLRAVAERLHGFLGFASRAFGQPLHRSEVIAAAQRVPGVVAIDLDVLVRSAPVVLRAITAVVRLPGPAATAGVNRERLLADGPRVQGGAVVGAELLEPRGEPRTWLTVMA